MGTRTKSLHFGQSRRARNLRRDVFLRDDFTCRVCGYRPETVPGLEYDGRYTVGRLHLDHIKPRCRGGLLCDISNAQTLCGTCNSRKGDRDGLGTA